jgi:hypothetical protein
MSYSDDFWKHIYYSPEGSDFFPFEKNSFIDWVNTNYKIKETEKFTTDDIFNKELIEVVFGTAPPTIDKEHALVQACINGEVTVSCAYYESSVSAYNTSAADTTFSTVNGIDPNNISYNNGITTVTYGGSTYEYGTHGGTCALHKNCTGTHLHYNNCALQTIKNADGDSMCKCVCDGGIKMGDGGTHTHCGTLSKIKEDDGTEKLVFTTGGGTGDTITYTYTDHNADPIEKKTDTRIAGQTSQELYIIYAKYYYELYRNKFLNSNMNRTFDTSKKAVNDATTKYKREYVLLYDYITGIFFVSGFIYFMYNEKF